MMYYEFLSHLQLFFGKKPTHERLSADEQAALKRHESNRSQDAARRQAAAEAKARLPKAA